jgi:NRPS condensation-like uncharacterized protein
MSEYESTIGYERKVTAAERFFARSPFAIVTMVLRIKGYVSEQMLRQAVSMVQQRHALLRVRIETDTEHAAWFTSDALQEIPIEIVPRESEDDWIEIHARASRLPFAFKTRPAIRFVLVQSPDRSEVIILCHHIICDGMSLAYLARDLMVHLGDPAREVEVLPAPPPIDLDNLPRDVSQPALIKFLIGRMNRKWAQEAVFFDQEDYEILTRTYWDHYHHDLLSIELSEAETTALVARCRDEQVTVNSALTAAFSGAQSSAQGEKPYHAKTVIAADLRNRLPRSPGEGMGMYAGGAELKLRYNHKRGFWENARQFHKRIQPTFTNKKLFSAILNWLYLDPTISEAMSFKKLGGLVPPDSARYEKLSAFSERQDVVLRLLQRDKLEMLEAKYWGTAVTNLGRLEFPTTYGALELDRLIMQPGGGIPLANANLVLGAVTCCGKLSLVVEYAREAVHSVTMQQIKDKAMEYLLER